MIKSSSSGLSHTATPFTASVYECAQQQDTPQRANSAHFVSLSEGDKLSRMGQQAAQESTAQACGDT